MDAFKYKLTIEEILKLKTKKSKKEMVNKLNNMPTSYHAFRALTFLIQTYPKDITVGYTLNNDIKHRLHHLANLGTYEYKELTEFCHAPYTVTPYHLSHLVGSRYTTYQMLAGIIQNVTKET